MKTKIKLGESVKDLVWSSVFYSIWVSGRKLNRNLIDESICSSINNLVTHPIDNTIRNPICIIIRYLFYNKKK
jgi:hypothetical protein